MASAKQFDVEATVLDATIVTIFTFYVEVEGFVFQERTDTLIWTGKPQAATFRFDVPSRCKLGQHSGTVRISQDGAPVGRVTFQIGLFPSSSDDRTLHFLMLLPTNSGYSGAASSITLL
jgi:hypothetical protein